jgi:hypothetical protein
MISMTSEAAPPAPPIARLPEELVPVVFGERYGCSTWDRYNLLLAHRRLFRTCCADVTSARWVLRDAVLSTAGGGATEEDEDASGGRMLRRKLDALLRHQPRCQRLHIVFCGEKGCRVTAATEEEDETAATAATTPEAREASEEKEERQAQQGERDFGADLELIRSRIPDLSVEIRGPNNLAAVGLCRPVLRRVCRAVTLDASLPASAHAFWSVRALQHAVAHLAPEENSGGDGAPKARVSINVNVGGGMIMGNADNMSLLELREACDRLPACEVTVCCSNARVMSPALLALATHLKFCGGHDAAADTVIIDSMLDKVSMARGLLELRSLQLEGLSPTLLLSSRSHFYDGARRWDVFVRVVRECGASLRAVRLVGRNSLTDPGVVAFARLFRSAAPPGVRLELSFPAFDAVARPAERRCVRLAQLLLAAEVRAGAVAFVLRGSGEDADADAEVEVVEAAASSSSEGAFDAELAALAELDAALHAGWSALGRSSPGRQ